MKKQLEGQAGPADEAKNQDQRQESQQLGGILKSTVVDVDARSQSPQSEGESSHTLTCASISSSEPGEVRELEEGRQVPHSQTQIPSTFIDRRSSLGGVLLPIVSPPQARPCFDTGREEYM